MAVSHQCLVDIRIALFDIACRRIFLVDYSAAEFVACRRDPTTTQSSLLTSQDAVKQDHSSLRDLFQRGTTPIVQRRNLYSGRCRRNLACQANQAIDETQPLSIRRDTTRANRAFRNTASRVCSVLSHR